MKLKLFASSSSTTSTITKKHSFLRKRIQNTNQLDYEFERKCREQQLANILRALLFVESKLRNEQIIIRKQLCEKDDVINRQMCTIQRLKRKYGDDDEEFEKIGEIAQYCPKCRKSYYLNEPKTFATQTDFDEDVLNIGGKVIIVFLFDLVYN